MKSAFFIIVFLVIGFLAGILFVNYSSLTLVKEVGIGDIVQLILAGIALPTGIWVLNKSLDEKRYVKDFLINDLSSYLNQLKLLQDWVFERADRGEPQITSNDRKFIMRKSSNLEDHLDSLIKQVTELYDHKSKDLTQNMKDCHILYWKSLTETLLDDGAVFDTTYVKELNLAYQKAVHNIKMSTYKINSL